MVASEKTRQAVYMATRIIVKCFQEQTRSCLNFLTQAAPYSLQSFYYKWVNLIQIQREVKWPHLSVGQMSSSHCKKNRWNGRKYCGHLGKTIYPILLSDRTWIPFINLLFQSFSGYSYQTVPPYSLWNLALDQGSNPGPLQWNCGNHNHWTTREVPKERF